MWDFVRVRRDNVCAEMWNLVNTTPIRKERLLIQGSLEQGDGHRHVHVAETQGRRGRGELRADKGAAAGPLGEAASLGALERSARGRCPV